MTIKSDTMKTDKILLMILCAGMVSFASCTKVEMTVEGSSDNSIQSGLPAEDWGEGNDAVLSPDRESRLKVSREFSELPSGALLSDDRATLRLPHYGSDFVLAVESDEELELQPVEGVYLFNAGQVDRGGEAYNGLTYVRITKALYAPGASSGKATLLFRRKSLAETYPEDRITVELSANPVAVEGGLDFDNPGYCHDFGRYVDNGLGLFVLPEGKEISVVFDEGEDSWLKLEEDGSRPRAWRVIGGWRPNDPKADGRVQSADIIIRDTNDGALVEEYTVSRRNFGLPVTWLQGVWWCKYNSMGDSREFLDQILSPEDPAAAAGKTVFDYLAGASPEEYRNLWQWAYIGDSGKGMKVIEKDGIPVMEGYSPGNVNINTLPPDSLSPDGYELPSMSDYNRVFDAAGGIWVTSSGTHTVKEPWEGHASIKREHRRKNDIQVGSLVLSDLLYVAMSSPDFPENEPVVFYGPGAQWNDQGIVHTGHCNNILFGVHSPEGSGWYFMGDKGGLYLTKNGAGPKDTRILRFKKSDVEYIY